MDATTGIVQAAVSDAGLPDDDRRHEYVGQIIDDVVEPGAGEVRQPFMNARPARQQSVGAVHQYRRDQPQERDPEIARDGCLRRQKREKRTACGVGVHEPRGPRHCRAKTHTAPPSGTSGYSPGCKRFRRPCIARASIPNPD